MSPHKSTQLQRGLTLVELMIALVISLLIVIAATSFYVGSSRSRDFQETSSTLQENARFATEIITRVIQQAGYQNYVYIGGSSLREQYEISGSYDAEPDIRGYNNSAGGASLDHGVHNRSTNRVNNSDTLVVRFQGSGNPADGSMIDCQGFPVIRPDAGSGDRAVSVFDVQVSNTGEPELRCKNSLSGQFTPIVRGVEMLQFMYGIDTNSDTFVDRWLNASEVSATGSATYIADWKRVRSVRVGMILRSNDTTGIPTGSARTLSPLGAQFTQSNGDTLTIPATDVRQRKVVTFTVNLRNSL
jgi:type IV pilus assembly protein PilW